MFLLLKYSKLHYPTEIHFTTKPDLQKSQKVQDLIPGVPELRTENMT